MNFNIYISGGVFKCSYKYKPMGLVSCLVYRGYCCQGRKFFTSIDVLNSFVDRNKLITKEVAKIELKHYNKVKGYHKAKTIYDVIDC